MSDSRAPYDALRSVTCEEGMHANCGHVGAFPRGRGGRASVLRCDCTCHSACVLAERQPIIPPAVWQQQCSCPGTEQALERHERSELERPERRAASSAAKEAARASKTPEQIRAIYEAELRSRGLTLPSGLVLDRYAEMLAGNAQAMSLTSGPRVLADFGKECQRLFWHRDSR
jgi:hypothetical protein